MQQHPNFARGLTMIGARVEEISLSNGMVQAIRRGPVTYIGRGLFERSSDLRQLRQRRLVILNAEADDDSLYRAAGFRKVLTGAYVAELNLINRPAPRTKWRQALRQSHALAFETTIRPLAPVDQWILDRDREQQITKRYRALPHGIVTHWPVGDTVACIAAEKGVPIAAMIFLIHGAAATYHIGWTSDHGRKLRAHHRLFDEAAQCLAQRGVQWLDLGTIDTVNTAGIARFKIGTGATVRQLGGTWIAAPTR